MITHHKKNMVHSGDWNMIQTWVSIIHEHHLTFNSRVNMRLWMFKQRFCYIEMINFNQWLKNLSYKYRNAAFYTSLAKMIYTNVWIHTSKMNTGNRIVVELVKGSNVTDGFGNVNYSGIFTLLTGTLHTKHHVDVVLIASKGCQWYITTTRPRRACSQ